VAAEPVHQRPDLRPRRREVLGGDDEAEGQRRLVRVEEATASEALRRVPRERVRGALPLVEVEPFLQNLRRQLDRLLHADGELPRLQLAP